MYHENSTSLVASRVRIATRFTFTKRNIRRSYLYGVVTREMTILGKLGRGTLEGYASDEWSSVQTFIFLRSMHRATNYQVAGR